jgi:hypothetical protein
VRVGKGGSSATGDRCGCWVEAMIADYTDDTNRYSDGSEVWKWYDEFPGCYFATKGELHLPPHRRTATSDKHIYGS